LVIGGQQVDSGDMIVADRDGVVVVPFARINEVIDRLNQVRSLETEMDAKVAQGQKISQAALAILESEQTTYLD